MSDKTFADPRPVRDVVVGCNSRVWQSLSSRLSNAGRPFLAISHRDAATFAFTRADRVWVLSFSRTAADNTLLLRTIAQAQVAEVIYVSSSSTIISGVTKCYEYPRVKHLAELDTLALAAGRVLTIGLVYDQPAELPGGRNAATSLDELAAFFSAPVWAAEGDRHTRLFRLIDRPFRSAFERGAFAAYGSIIKAAGSFPCLLRPVDMLLRACGARWYGYTHLSNKAWISTIS